MDEYEQSLIVFPALRRLGALLHKGLDGVDTSVRRALDREDYSKALQEANRDYGRRGVKDERALLIYACLLVGRELVVEARALLEKGLEVHGDKPELLVLLADALVLAGEVDAAGETLSRLDTAAIERAPVAAFAADVYLDLDDEDAAIALYERAVDAGIEEVEPAIRLGQLQLGRDRVRPAAEAFEYAARLARDRLGLWRTTSELWFELGEQRRGLTARLRLLELQEETSADDWLELGLHLAAHASFEDALDALAEAEQFDPFDREPLIARGHVLLEMGRAEEALAAFDKADKIRGQSAAVHRGAALAALLIGDLSLARRRAERAVELAEDDADAAHTLGVVLQQFGRHGRALDEIDRAIALDDARADYHVSRSLSLAADAQADAAVEAFERAVALDERTVEGMPDVVAALVKRGHLDQAGRIIEQVDAGTDVLELVRPLCDFILGPFADEAFDAQAAARRIEAAVDAHPELVPLDIDYDQVGRLASSMESVGREHFVASLNRLMGDRPNE
jgi:tetratricopeptide (TPR) repeat protein